MSLLEVVVPEGARIVGRSALSVRLLYRHDVTLLGVSRQGKRFTDRVRKLEIQAGDGNEMKPSQKDQIISDISYNFV